MKELIESLKSHDVEFLVVGAHALAHHGRPRFTEDLDLFLRRTAENEVALTGALREFGIPISAEAAHQLMSFDRQMIVLGHAPNAVDLLNFLDGVDFDEAWTNRVEGDIFGVKTWMIGKEDFVKTKRASGRPKDLLDLELLAD
ncbi:MAG: nucleotidyltransferase [Armatimonadetes bacterium]|nr:nucleotidyltransferase [Armatimonadota bacterium]